MILINNAKLEQMYINNSIQNSDQFNSKIQIIFPFKLISITF